MTDVSELLTKALSGVGADALPYEEHQKWTLRQHLTDLLQEFPALRPSVQTHTQNDGRTVKLLRVEGTVPMYHQGVKYNIPVGMWLPEGYPRTPPALFVQPTPDMMISRQHAFVDASGAVRSSYIVSWDPSRSNLVDMAHDTSIQFGEAPPLFAKPPGWLEDDAAAVAAMRPEAAHPVHQSSASAGPMEDVFLQNPMISPAKRDYHGSARDSSPAADLEGASLWGGAMTAAQQQAAFEQQQLYDRRQQQQQHQQQQQQQQHQQHQGGPPPDGTPQANGGAGSAADDLNAEFRAGAAACLTRRLRDSLASAAAQAAGDTNSLLELQGELQRRAGQLRHITGAMAGERRALEASVLEMNTKGAEVARWLAANEGRTPAEPLDPDVAIEPADTLCAQALAAQAEDMAIEDTLYALERAFQNNALDAAVYLKQVRVLCGKQFYARALGMKLAALQHSHGAPGDAAAQHAQRPAAAPGPAGRSVQMQIGDSWTSTGLLSNPLQSL